MTKPNIIAKFTVEIPRVPNFLRVKETDSMIPLYHVDEEILAAIGREWTNNLKARAKEQLKADVAKAKVK